MQIDIPSSLMMYPIPYPSGVTGPNPNRRRAGLPQLEVERTDVPRRLYPGSVNIEGTLRVDLASLTASESSRGVWISRWMSWYIAYRCLDVSRR